MNERLYVDDNNTIVAKNQFGYNVLGLIIDKENKRFQIVSGQILPIGKYKKTTRKAIWEKAEELKCSGYENYIGYGSVSGALNS